MAPGGKSALCLVKTSYQRPPGVAVKKLEEGDSKPRPPAR